ncbi:MAG UNVERIFIED_CONTAM: hypothetical protein LVR18_25390 [Planctomycetaceae bacterium]
MRFIPAAMLNVFNPEIPEKNRHVNTAVRSHAANPDRRLRLYRAPRCSLLAARRILRRRHHSFRRSSSRTAAARTA